ncbi:hypothetical protein [Parabacteroides hominis]|uniref:DUF4143 domain-containing protein n=1 Tax=Parabacteroides hominis TaxID=2763057 RepID=A0ABR7DPK1_9BACT|nr:hypothetical protein [Parabacteroides hominis]MBC5633359.1 hypothetical protein [Parabacteroides hominis]
MYRNIIERLREWKNKEDRKHSNDAKLEIDFLIQYGSEIVPIEAKAEENLRAKSLYTFVSSRPGMHGLRFSMSDYREQDWMTNVPLYAVTTCFK